MLSRTPKTWVEADDVCANEITGGHLVDIESEDEQDFVEDLLFTMFTSRIEYAWFGLRRLYEWSDGSPQVVAKWQHLYTDDTGTCFRIHEASGSYEWRDHNSFEKEYRFLCEIEGK